MEHLDIILPIILLFVTFLMKLLIAEEFKPARIISEICSVPTDVIFLAISFLIAILISSDGQSRNNGLYYLFVFFGLAMVTVLLSKLSAKGFDANRNFHWIWMIVLNFIITIFCLRCSIISITKPDTEKNKPSTQSPVKNQTNGQ